MKVEFLAGTPPLVNEATSVEWVFDAARTLLGKDAVRPLAELKPAPDPTPSALAVARRPAPTTKRITRPTPLVAKPAPVTKPKDTPPALRTYTVRKKDTLWSIAKRLLGDGQRWKEIVAANPGLDPQKLMPGQTIKLPER